LSRWRQYHYNPRVAGIAKKARFERIRFCQKNPGVDGCPKTYCQRHPEDKKLCPREGEDTEEEVALALEAQELDEDELSRWRQYHYNPRLAGIAKRARFERIRFCQNNPGVDGCPKTYCQRHPDDTKLCPREDTEENLASSGVIHEGLKFSNILLLFLCCGFAFVTGYYVQQKISKNSEGLYERIVEM